MFKFKSRHFLAAFLFSEGTHMVCEISLIELDQWRAWKALRLEGLAECPSSFSASLKAETAAPDEDFMQRIKNNAIFEPLCG